MMQQQRSGKLHILANGAGHTEPHPGGCRVSGRPSRTGDVNYGHETEDKSRNLIEQNELREVGGQTYMRVVRERLRAKREHLFERMLIVR
jgi:hypothetical protein